MLWGLAGGAAGKAGLGNDCCYLHFPDATWEWQAEGRWVENQSPWLIEALVGNPPGWVSPATRGSRWEVIILIPSWPHQLRGASCPPESNRGDTVPLSTLEH